MGMYKYSSRKPKTTYSVGKKTFKTKATAINYAKKTGASRVKKTSWSQG